MAMMARHVWARRSWRRGGARTTHVGVGANLRPVMLVVREGLGLGGRERGAGPVGVVDERAHVADVFRPALPVARAVLHQALVVLPHRLAVGHERPVLLHFNGVPERDERTQVRPLLVVERARVRLNPFDVLAYRRLGALALALVVHGLARPVLELRRAVRLHDLLELEDARLLALRQARPVLLLGALTRVPRLLLGLVLQRLLLHRVEHRARGR